MKMGRGVGMYIEFLYLTKCKEVYIGTKIQLVGKCTAFYNGATFISSIFSFPFSLFVAFCLLFSSNIYVIHIPFNRYFSPCGAAAQHGLWPPHFLIF
jgi:hypothetical protein